MNGLHHFFTPLDWAVVVGYFLLATLVGFLMRGKQASIKDFFLGGRSLPWPAVTGAIIATEISGLTFIVVPAMVVALQGDFTYLQWAIGSISGRILVGLFFVKVFYENDVYSPYDFMGCRLGSGVKTFATIIFTVGNILAQSARVLFVALLLRVVTALPFEWCIAVICFFAMGWTLMGGMRTVIWTDVMQVALFTIGGTMALAWMLGNFENGWQTLYTTAGAAEQLDGTVIDKLRVFNFSTLPELRLTFWVAIFAVPFLNLNAFGADQVNAQRLFCCRGSGDAKKAIIWSSAGQLLTALMLMIGAALFVFYMKHPPTDPLIMGVMKWSAGQSGSPDMVFPVWILTELPTGMRGLMLSCLFAAAISSLDSILAALSQTTLSMLRRTDGDFTELEHLRLVRHSRFLVVFWGAVLTGFTFVLFAVHEKTNASILPLAFGMTTYTVGPLLGMFLIALLGGGRGSVKGLIAGALISFVLVFFVRNDVWVLFMNDALALWLAKLPSYELVEGPPMTVRTTLASEWMWPITTFLTMALGWVFGKKKPH